MLAVMTEPTSLLIARIYVPLPVEGLPELGQALEVMYGKGLALAPGTDGASFDVVKPARS